MGVEPVAYPQFDMDSLMTVLLGLLGLGTASIQPEGKVRWLLR